MKKLFLTLGAALGMCASLAASAVDGVNTNVKLTCNVAGLYADGARVQGSGSEEISIDIRRVAPGNATSDIRITSNGRVYEAALLKSTAQQVAFSFANDALVDGIGQTLALTYEIRLDRLRLKRTAMTLFSGQGNTTQSAEGNCVRLAGTPVTPAAAAAATAAPAAAAAPDWLVELRRKLKECGTKDPFSQASCVERMKARYCANRTIRVPECEGR